MNNTLFLQQIAQTGNLDSNLNMRRYTPDLMPMFMEIKAAKPRLGQDQLAKELGCSSSTLQRYRHDLKMLSTL